MKKYIPLALLVLFGVAALLASFNKSAEAIDPATQRMIEQDHMMVGLIVNYIAEMQQRGVLPKQEEKK